MSRLFPNEVSGFNLLKSYLTQERQITLLEDCRSIIRTSPLFVPRMPRYDTPFRYQMLQEAGTTHLKEYMELLQDFLK